MICGAAECFYRGQLADDGVALRHVGDADGQDDGDDRGKSLRNGGDRERYGDHKGIEHDSAGEISRDVWLG